MHLRAIFENRSGRVIAVLRVALAFVFLVALAFEPVTTGESIRDGLILTSGYALLTLAVVAVAWRSWWLDQRLAPAMLVIDVVVFLGAVFVTEGYDADFTSPFLALFALTVLSSTLRWDWAIAARTGAIVSLLFILLGLVLAQAGFPIDFYRFSRRAFYMVALLLVLVWFGIDRRGAQVPPLDPGAFDLGLDEQGRAVLAYAMAVTGADHGIIAWADREEPWTEIREVCADGSHTSWRVGPGEVDAATGFGQHPRLFDLARGLALVPDERGRAVARRDATPIPLAARAGIAEGLAVPLSCSSRDGLIVLGGIDGPGPDFLALGRAIAREIETTADRTTANRLERETAVMRARGAIARDLHDSVAQSLAGACFRLEALRRTLAQGAESAGDAAAEIATVRDALRGEQAQVRGMIDTLRDRTANFAEPPLAEDLGRALADAAAHWNLSANFTVHGQVDDAAGLAHELRQLLREAVANAARHGHARQVQASLGRTAAGLVLEVADDGTGFDDPLGTPPPWSIGERVAALGGQLEVVTGTHGTRLAISLPLTTRPEPA